MELTYAFVFARGGSKGLPGKNLKLLAGKPLLQYSIDVAKSIDGIADVFVSTDDKAIAEVAIASGAKVINRPPELATDTAPEWLAWQHAVEYVFRQFGPFRFFVSLPATSPLRNSKDVELALDELKYTNSDICIGVTPSARNPYFNMVNKLPNGDVRLICEGNKLFTRRQDAPNCFDITTVVYAAPTEFILEANNLFDGKVCCVEVPKERSVDIDDLTDFYLAEILLSKRGDFDAR